MPVSRLTNCTGEKAFPRAAVVAAAMPKSRAPLLEAEKLVHDFGCCRGTTMLTNTLQEWWVVMVIVASRGPKNWVLGSVAPNEVG